MRCSGPCNQDVAARDAREAVLTWPKTASGEGGTTDAAAPMHINVWICAKCFRGRVDPRGPQPPELAIIAARIAQHAKDVLTFLIPERTYLIRPSNKEIA